ncbi:murein DD-endopeptidase MepM [Veronia pacifica]|uniref:Peptigoglycan-binding protein LysM n=1 Tax=Veronia pacifica TaxID=1080227 RepID=A0A1C3ERL0_9GAMM|nr:murein DD-endopeptidase MepM [Veronia pacifica]ODA35838.1 peptigoglycan-binding protein LysM [Veronia pacifica]
MRKKLFSGPQKMAAQLQTMPRIHRLSLITMSFLMVAVAIWTPTHHTERDVTRKVIPLDKASVTPISNDNSEPMDVLLDPDDPALKVEQDEIDKQLAKEDSHQHSHVIVDGDSLSSVFGQYGLSLNDMYALVKANSDVSKLRVGQTLRWQVDDDGKLTSFEILRNRKNTDVFTISSAGITYKQQTAKGEFRDVTVKGVVKTSFYVQARQAGLTPGQIQELVSALQWRFDLGKQARRNDRFYALISREFVDGERFSSGEVQGFLYRSGRNEIMIYRHTDGKFYDQDGQSLQRAFRRLPLTKRYRISSPFNPHRLHPITGRISPHNGTDFATPIGTAVLATGDGVVVKAQKHRLAGNFVVIKHGREYTTRYLHLSKILVKKGQRVKMGQKIALSGNTGRSTGPHLHYELHRFGRPVNAMKVPLPQASPIPAGQRSEFVARLKRAESRIEG